MIFQIVVHEYDGLTHECAAFSAADVEGVGKSGEIGKSHVTAFCSETVAHACAIHEKIEAVLPTDSRDIFQFLL